MSELSEKVLSIEQLRDIDIRLQCVKLGEGDVRMAEGIYKFVTGAEDQVTGGSVGNTVAIRPAYFVCHPGGTYSLADPQPS